MTATPSPELPGPPDRPGHPGGPEHLGGPGGPERLQRPERTAAEWEAVFREDLDRSVAAERHLVWMELIALGAVAVVIVLHFVWH